MVKFPNIELREQKLNKMKDILKKLLETDNNAFYRVFLAVLGLVLGCAVVGLALVVDNEKVAIAFISIGSAFAGCMLIAAGIDWIQKYG